MIQKGSLALLILVLLALLGIGVFAGPGAEWYGWVRTMGPPALGFCFLMYLDNVKREVIDALKQG